MLSVSTQLTPTDNRDRFEAMLSSVAFADEIVVFVYDGVEEDYLKKLKKQFPLHTVSAGYPQVVEVIRARQVKEPKGEWVLVMDFDEVVTPELQTSILSAVQREPAVYSVCRRNFSLGFPLRYGGWGDDFVVRLFHQKVFRDWPTDIHSMPIFDCGLKKLDGYLEHHKDESLTYIVNKTNRYSDVEAQQFFEGGLPPVNVVTLVRKPVMEFIRRYFLKKGFLDGRIGLIQSIYQSFSVFITYSKLYEKQINTKSIKK